MNAQAMRYVCRVIEALEAKGQDHAVDELQAVLQTMLDEAQELRPEVKAAAEFCCVELASFLCLHYGVNDSID